MLKVRIIACIFIVQLFAAHFCIAMHKDRNDSENKITINERITTLRKLGFTDQQIEVHMLCPDDDHCFVSADGKFMLTRAGILEQNESSWMRF